MPEEEVRATLPFLSPQVAAMVRLQLADRGPAGRGRCPAALRHHHRRPTASGSTGRPEHKTEHLDRERVIMLGPSAQEVLRPWLDRDPDGYCFSPAEVVEARNARKRAGRRSPMTPVAGCPAAPKPEPKRAPGPCVHPERLSDGDPAGVPQGRGADLVALAVAAQRRHGDPARYGLEAAQVVLGHAKADITEVYAEKDLDSGPEGRGRGRLRRAARIEDKRGSTSSLGEGLSRRQGWPAIPANRS